MIRTWIVQELNDNDLPEHYVTGEIDGILVSLQVRVGAPTSTLNPMVVAERIAVALHNGGLT